MNFNLIGAGRLGQNLALSLIHQCDVTLLGICNQTQASAAHAVSTIQSGRALSALTDLPPADFILITTPDDAISSIVKQLAECQQIKPGQVIIHCSGVLSSDILNPLRNKGCFVASVHPLKAFRTHHLQQDAFRGCYCVLEGDTNALSLLKTLLAQMGAEIIISSELQKSTYHAAAVMASNYLVTLAGCAIELFTDSGLTFKQAKIITEHLMQDSLNNVKETTHPKDALTGPLVRGDLDTIKKHLSGIQSPQINTLYRIAAIATQSLTPLSQTMLDALETNPHGD